MFLSHFYKGGSFNDFLFASLDGQVILDFVVVVALLFYVHGKHLRSCQDGQLT